MLDDALSRHHARVSLTSLYLAPQDPESSVDLAVVQSVLTRLEIIGSPIDGQTFLAGQGFSREVVYAGCSPYLIMKPPDDGSLQFCHVALHGPLSSPQLVLGPNTVKPRCPHCRQRLDDWRAWLAAGWSEVDQFPCSNCQAPLTPCAADWRENALCARMMVELRNVFPGEATPSDRLLDALQDATATPWRYAWAAYFNQPPSVQPTTT